MSKKDQRGQKIANKEEGLMINNKEKNLKLLILGVWVIIILALCFGLYFTFTNLSFRGNSKLEIGQVLPNSLQAEKNSLSPEMSSFITARQKLEDGSPIVSLLAVGDLSFSRGVEQTIIKNNNLEYPFEKLGNFLSQADISFGNLESPLTPGRVIQSGEMIFRSDPKMAEVLKSQGFDILSLANNHTPNFGSKGLRDTFNYLDEVGIAYVGAGEDGPRAYAPVYLERQGLIFAFIAQNDFDVVPDYYRADEKGPGTALFDEDKLILAITEAKEQADLVIVSMHSGTEYVPGPNTRQIKFAHAAIDFGADLVIGHHPHVVQTIEEYKGRYIFYSLGNFVFDQAWSQATADSLAVKFYFDKDGLLSFSNYPLRMYKLAQPAPAEPEDAERILKRLDWPLVSRADYSWQDGKLINATQLGVLLKEAKAANLKKKQSADLNNDGVTEDYFLEQGRLMIRQGDSILWESPESWWIEDFLINNKNDKAKAEIIIALWHSGDLAYSKNSPWTTKSQEDLSVRQFLLRLQNDANDFKVAWISDALESPLCSLFLKDINNDTYPELISLFSTYDNLNNCQPQGVAAWKLDNEELVLDWKSDALEDLAFSSINLGE